MNSDFPVTRRESGQFLSFSAITFITDHRMPKIRKMNADLMGSTGQDLYFDKRDKLKGFQDFPACFGMFTKSLIIVSGIFLSVGFVPTNIFGCYALWFFKNTPDQCCVEFIDLPVFEFSCHEIMGIVIFSRYNST